jgi:uncharacterized protein
MPAKRNLMICGGIFHPFEATSTEVAAILSNHDIDTVVEFDVAAGFARLRAQRWDLLTVHCLSWSMAQREKYAPYRAEFAFSPSDEDRRGVREHLNGGGGLLGLHTASLCFDTWPEWGGILGAGWVWDRSHHPEPCAVAASIVDPDHPIVAGLPAFDVPDELYCDLEIAADAVVLAVGRADAIPDPQPIVTVRGSGSGRVVYSALGHDAASFAVGEHRELVGRAARWACGLI